MAISKAHQAVAEALKLANETIDSLTAKNLELSSKIKELTSRFEALKAENERLEAKLDSKPAAQPARLTPKVGDPAGQPWIGRDGVRRQKFWVDVNRRWTTTREVA